LSNDHDPGVFDTAVAAYAALMGWDKKVNPEPPEPNARMINLWVFLGMLLGVYYLPYALVPVGIRRLPVWHRSDGGYHVHNVRQLHIFGVRAARWFVGEVVWVPDEPKLKVADPIDHIEAAEEELTNAMSEKVTEEIDQQIGDENAPTAADEKLEAAPDCPACEGHGVVEGHICHDCGGCGYDVGKDEDD
jgi:hypothetical protein